MSSDGNPIGGLDGGASRTKKRQRDIMNAAYQNQKQTLDKTTGMLQSEGQNMQGDARMHTMDSNEAAALAQTQSDLNGSGAAEGIDVAGDGGNVSSDFLKARADRALSEGNRMTALAREAAKIRAPGLTQAGDKMRTADLMSRTGSMWSSTRAAHEAAMRDAQGVGPTAIDQFGNLAKTAAMLAIL